MTLIVLNKTFFVIYSIIRIKNHYKNEQLSSNVENKVSIYYLSSFLVAITNLILRLSISNDLSTEMASTLIFCFSLASMPSTLYLNSIGINILIYRKFFPTYFKIIIYIYTIIFFYTVIENIFNINLFFNSNFYETLFFSFLGSFILLKSQIIRLKQFINKNYTNKVMKTDVVLSIIQIFIIILVSLFFKNLYIYIFLVFSILSIFIYTFFIVNKI